MLPIFDCWCLLKSSGHAYQRHRKRSQFRTDGFLSIALNSAVARLRLQYSRHVVFATLYTINVLPSHICSTPHHRQIRCTSRECPSIDATTVSNYVEDGSRRSLLTPRFNESQSLSKPLSYALYIRSAFRACISRAAGNIHLEGKCTSKDCAQHSVVLPEEQAEMS